MPSKLSGTVKYLYIKYCDTSSVSIILPYNYILVILKLEVSMVVLLQCIFVMCLWGLLQFSVSL